MPRPKDSRGSNRYKGNQLMIAKIYNCADQLLAVSRPKPSQEIARDKRAAAQAKHQRKQQRRQTSGT